MKNILLLLTIYISLLSCQDFPEQDDNDKAYTLASHNGRYTGTYAYDAGKTGPKGNQTWEITIADGSIQGKVHSRPGPVDVDGKMKDKKGNFSFDGGYRAGSGYSGYMVFQGRIIWGSGSERSITDSWIYNGDRQGPFEGSLVPTP